MLQLQEQTSTPRRCSCRRLRQCYAAELLRPWRPLPVDFAGLASTSQPCERHKMAAHLTQAHGCHPALEGIHELPGGVPAVERIEHLAGKGVALGDCVAQSILRGLGLPLLLCPLPVCQPSLVHLRSELISQSLCTKSTQVKHSWQGVLTAQSKLHRLPIPLAAACVPRCT